jgi:protein-serine/threonine kinase
MLAGYLPFDDDPANPEGDNINLLYKYIVSTPLTFPEYVTPHARDLLRRILVPDPRRRADLFEVARHSWLSPFADIVSKVTSATTGIKDVETVTVRGLYMRSPVRLKSLTLCTEPKPDAPGLGRSHSVREPSSASHPHAPGALGTRHHAHDQIPPPSQAKPSSDNKRRTVQVEYVEPQTQTKRGSAVDPDDKEEDDAAPPPVVSQRKERESGNVARAATTAGTTPRTFENFRDQREARIVRDTPKEEPKLQAPEKGKTRPISYAYQQSTAASRAAATDGPSSGPPSSRSGKDRTGLSVSGTTKPVSDGSGSGESGTRPNTANSLGSNRLPSHGSYSQPAAPSLAANNVQGRMASTPKGKAYQISAPIPQADGASPDFAADNRPVTQPDQGYPKGHKRANTVGGVGDSNRFLGKIMGGSSNTDRPDAAARPPVVGGSSSNPRQSLDQSRSGKMDKSGKSRRFSLLPTSFSLRNMTGEGKHERKLSRSNSRYAQGTTQQSPEVHSQPTLGVTGNDDASHMSGSEASMAPGSAPPSAFRDSVDTTTVVTPAKKTMLSRHKKFTDAFDSEVSSGGHGSSGPARRVMDFFRRRGTARSKSEKAEKEKP